MGQYSVCSVKGIKPGPPQRLAFSGLHRQNRWMIDLLIVLCLFTAFAVAAVW